MLADFTGVDTSTTTTMTELDIQSEGCYAMKIHDEETERASANTQQVMRKKSKRINVVLKLPMLLATPPPPLSSKLKNPMNSPVRRGSGT